MRTAGSFACANAANGKSAGFINPLIYAAKAKTAFRDITSGNNGYYNAGAGWDPCTGLGSPVGTALQSALQSIVKANPPVQPSNPGGSGKPTKNPPRKNPTKKAAKVH